MNSSTATIAGDAGIDIYTLGKDLAEKVAYLQVKLNKHKQK